MRNSEGLLGITAAAKLLGVHPLTLRSWAEKGYVPHYRTPGGHRRFKRGELLGFVAQMNQGSPEDGLVVAARSAIRQAISTLPEDQPELAVKREHMEIATDQREMMREVGQKLLELTVQYASGAAGKQVMVKAREIGRTYGDFSVQHGMSLSEAVATFNFFRDTIIEATFEANVKSGDIDISNPQLYRRLNRFFNEVLLETVRTAETILSE